MAAKYGHIHKYVRDKLGKMTIYKCALAGCPHYLRSNLAVGKLTNCWYCDTEFVMTKKSVKLKKPHCSNCVVAHNAKPVAVPMEKRREMDQTFFETILPGIVEGE